MAKNLDIVYLLDVYGEILTEKQKDTVELYYHEDLSLAEISEHLGITRQGVRDSIKRAENQLLDLESKMGLAHRFGRIEKGLAEIEDCANQILEENPAATRNLSQKTQQIIDVVLKLRN